MLETDLKTEIENCDDVKPDFYSTEKQKTRSLLRERFLRAVTKAVGKKCTLEMHGNTKVEGIFKGNDIDFQNLLVDDLKTPFNKVPQSIIRASDLLVIKFNNFE